MKSLDNAEMSKLPVLVKRYVILSLGTIGIALGISTTIIIYSLCANFIIAITFSLTGSTLLIFFLIWMMLTTYITPRWVHLEDCTFTLERSNGKKKKYEYSKLLGFANAQKHDDETGKPLWTVLYIGRSMFSANMIFLTYDNSIQMKNFLEEIDVRYGFNYS